MKSNQPILITGSHRSGSTWVGKIIAKSPDVGYIQEPFNLDHRRGILRTQFNYWFTYINQENEFLYADSIKDMLTFKYNLLKEVTDIRYWKDGLRLLRDSKNFLTYRLTKVRPLIKDPIAFFSSEWLSSTFNMDVIVLIRHPAAFVSSLKRVNWTFPFSHFLAQPLLMRDHLYVFEDEIKNYATKELPIIDQACLLWKIIHYMILKYQENHRNWLFIRHEDISNNPLESFEKIFNALHLDYSKKVKEEVFLYTNSNNPLNPYEKVHLLKRDSKANIFSWKSRLTENEISYIKQQVREISVSFYSDSEW